MKRLSFKCERIRVLWRYFLIPTISVYVGGSFGIGHWHKHTLDFEFVFLKYMWRFIITYRTKYFYIDKIPF